MVSALLLELEGVLVDTRAARFHALRTVLAEDGHTLDEGTFTDVADGLAPFEAAGAIAARLPGEHDATAIELLALRADRAFSERASRGVTLMPGARALLEEAAARVPLALVTRARRPFVEMVLDLADATAFFQAIVSVEDVRDAKPAPEGHLRALARLSARRPLAAADVVALEDSLSGIRAARRAGIRCVAVGAIPAHRAMEANALLPSLEGCTLADVERVLAPISEERQ